MATKKEMIGILVDDYAEVMAEMGHDKNSLDKMNHRNLTIFFKEMEMKHNVTPNRVDVQRGVTVYNEFIHHPAINSRKVFRLPQFVYRVVIENTGGGIAFLRAVDERELEPEDKVEFTLDDLKGREMSGLSDREFFIGSVSRPKLKITYYR